MSNYTPPPPLPPIAEYAGREPGPSRGTSALAIVSLVLSCLGLCIPLLGIAGMICGIIAITRTGPGKLGGRGLAIAGTSVGGASLVVSCLLLSILLPSLNRAREVANRVKCASNMRQIGQAMLLYANENRGQYPPNPQLLLTTQDIGNAVFVCPSTNDAPAATLGPGSNSYVYVGAGLTSAAGSQTVLLYEPLANHGNDGGNVLFGDGTVQFFPAPQLKQLISTIRPAAPMPR